VYGTIAISNANTTSLDVVILIINVAFSTPFAAKISHFLNQFANFEILSEQSLFY